VQLFGRLDGADGAPFLIEDDRTRPSFFVPRVAVDRLRSARGIEVRPTALRDLAGREVAEVVVDTPAAVARLRDRLGSADALEADVRFAYRYLIDRGLRAGVAITGEPQRAANGLLRFENPDLAPAESRPALRVVSLDLETTPDASRVLAFALVGAGADADEVHLLADRPVAGARAHADEPALLRALLARIAALDPDVLLGWNLVDFDLRVLAARCA